MKRSPQLGRHLTWVTTLALCLLATGAWAAVQPETGWGMPRDVSLDGWRIDWLINITGIFVSILFVIMVIWMVAACVLHNEKHTAQYDHGDAKRSVAMALAISALIFFVIDGNLFVNSVIDMREAFWNFEKAEADPGAVRIEVNAHQWAWDARYAGIDGVFNTADDIVTLNEIPVPVDAPIIVQLAAVDVLHAIYFPNLRQKIDAVPGTINQLWFQATETGDFDIGCAQHCGTHHYKMKGLLRILPREEYDLWQYEMSARAARAFDGNDKDALWGWVWKRG